MIRQDYDMAFMLRYENVAWYEDGKVRILDRRVYPTEVRFEICKTYEDVARAIADMVTQSAGPYTAAGMGMALAAYECRDLVEAKQIEFMEKAGERLSTARPTTRFRMQQVTDGCMVAFHQALKSGESTDQAIFQRTLDSLNRRYRIMTDVGKNLVKLFPNKGKIMTQCFGETIVGTMLREAKIQNKDIQLFVPETRPYFQGARLTASVSQDMGFDTTVITDNMVAFTMEREGIDIFTSAADVISLDGHVVNKIGTYQMSILAKYHKIPYFVTGIPDKENKNIESVTIEFRDPSLVLEARGIKNTMDGVKGYYPSFDIVPPHLVSGIVTDMGIFTPYNISEYYKNIGEKVFY